FVFFLFEVVTESIIFVRGDEGAESGKQNRIFAGLVRAIHAKEGAKSVRQFVGVGNIFKSRKGGEFANLRGQQAAGFVLRKKSIHQVDQLADLAKAREQEIFFELLVVVLDEMADDVGGADQYGAIESLLGGEHAKVMVVD